MAESMLSVRINKNDKSDFEKFCKETGLNVSTAINMFVKTVLREKKIPFEITTIKTKNDIDIALQEAEKDIENNITYTSDEVFNSLNKYIK